MIFIENIYDYLVEDPHGNLTLYTHNKISGCLYCYVYKNGYEYYGLYNTGKGNFNILDTQANSIDRKGFIYKGEHPVTFEEMNRLMALEDVS